MKIKKLFASILTITILISSLSLSSFARSTIQLNGTNQTYLGKNVDLDSWIKSTIPSFNGIPDRVPGDGAFYSNKGEIKLDINDQNRSYFENGGSVYIFVKKADNCLHLNPINYKNFLAFKPKDGINTFKINGPSQGFSHVFNSLGKALSFIFPNTTTSILLSSIIFCSISCFSSSAAFKFLLFSLFGPSALKVTALAAAPIFNLLANTNPNIVNFDYGIVLTDKDDEKVLNPNLPKAGDFNEKALKDFKEQKEKEADVLHKVGLNTIDIISVKKAGYPSSSESTSASCCYTKQNIDKIKKEIEAHKHITYDKLVNSAPINNGFVCKLDKDHPSQTFRFVVNNQFPDNPNNADLFALALQNNSINLSQTSTNVSFTASYNAIDTEKSDVFARLTNVPFEVQQKINLIQNIGNPGILSKIIDWFRSWIDFFNFDSGKVNIPVTSAQSGQQGGGNNQGAAGNGGQPPQGGGGNNPPAGKGGQKGKRQIKII